MKKSLHLKLIACSILLSANCLAQVKEKITKADQAFAKSDWSGYGQIYTDLVQHSPDNGEYWYRIGIAQSRLGKIDEAINAYQRSYQIGYLKARSALRLASLQAQLQHPQQAVDWFVKARQLHLVNAEQELMQDPHLSKLVQDAKWNKVLFPVLPQDVDRLSKWKADLDFFQIRVQESHWSLFEQVERKIWQDQIDQLRKDLSNLDDWKIKMRLNQLVRLGKSGHSLLIPEFDGDDAFHLANLQIAAFADGWYVKSAAKEHAALVGKKVLRIGSPELGLSPDLALQRLQSAIPHETAAGLRYIGARMMLIPEYLHFFGLEKSRDQLHLSLQDAQGVVSEFVVATPSINMERLQKVLMSAWTPENWTSIATTPSTPLWLQQPHRHFWFTTLKDDKLIYFQFNQVRDGDESLADFSIRLERALKSPSIKGLVIDVRHNNGGNGQLLEPLRQALTRVDSLRKPGKIYVLIGGKTFSAASQFIADLEQSLPVTFVGEMSGSGPTHVGEDNMILLPNSRTKILAASRLFVRSFSDDYRSGIAPHIQVVQSFFDLQNGRDTVLEAALSDFRKQSK